MARPQVPVEGIRPGKSTQRVLDFAAAPPTLLAETALKSTLQLPVAEQSATDAHVALAGTEKAKARDLLASIRTLQRIEREQRPATEEERKILARFPGFGAVANYIFPTPGTDHYKPGWRQPGEELRSLLTPVEYASAKKSTVNAYYTSSIVIKPMHEALARLGVPENALVLEPGCGPGRFAYLAPKAMRFIGVELDSISGRIARALHPAQDIRIEDFENTRLPPLDAVIGNVPFANIYKQYGKQSLALHDFFIAKSVDALKPGGIAVLITSHFTLDKQNAAIRQYLGNRADFLGAIRLPSDAFKREGTAVVTDIIFLRKRQQDVQASHADPAWLWAAPFPVDGAEVTINKYFLNHPEMVLGTWSRKNLLYGKEGYSLESNGDLAQQLREAVERLPRFQAITASAASIEAPAPFTPPPPDRKLTEGSLYIAGDGRIHEIEDGQGVPVVYGGSELWEHGAKIGRRLAALIRLLEQTDRVLQSQNEGWPDAEREEQRRRLRGLYDRFVGAYGPINTTTFSETKDGTVIRRMPNLVKFRDDPRAMLVMALEDYDEVTGKAAKAPIMLCDVVGRKAPVTSVTTAEEGLLVSLDQHGLVDLPFIAQLYGKPEETVIAELGDLIYQDPVANEWQTADAYLSGNVRVKLAQAESAGPEYARNAAALRAVQPEDVLPGDIDANLGAPWIPESDIQTFAAHLFGVEADGIQVAHLKKDAVWCLDCGYSAEHSVAATAEYGTPRANGTWLLELALNMKTPTVYDPDPADSEKRVVNQEQTLAAREKQKLIKEKFKGWIFSDPDRTERLVRIYNDLYNCMRPRVFDGSHLHFPGMSQVFKLRKHQVDAIWRGMCSGNTLLAHCVGAGKTAVQAATGMKMRQTGLTSKPLFEVPNHMLEQFGREFMQLYPNARLLLAGKEDFARENRKRLTAKIATGDWDAVIMTHSGAEHIGMSREYQEKFLNEQIEEYEQLICESGGKGAQRARRNLIKTIEKQKAAREEKLKNLLAEDKKDDGLVFDELGIDHIFVDESHFFKNLETPTKMERVAGIQTGGSERAFDLFMKCRYLDEQHPGHGVTFATGTPISNSLVEMYTLQRLLDPAGLKSRGIYHFDSWAAQYGEVVDSIEISPDGKTLKPRARFARFVNLPELLQSWLAFADVQTPEMLNLPRPALAGGKPHIIACPMSDEQAALQQNLVRRYERIRSSKVDPREDNALAITTDGRKLALDARMLSSEARDEPGSKINALVENVHRIWEETVATRSTQMIFSDMGVNPTPWGFSAYGEIVEKLTARGIPEAQIAVIGEADSDAKKQALFDRVRNGQVRVLIGSTQKLGTGTNVQKRLVALHHLDCTWKPAEIEQREGRILRQGNDNKEVAIYRYVTEGSFDSFMWQCLETKARFISQIMTGDLSVRKAEDIGGQELSYAEVKAIASGNPAVLTLAEADAEIQRLSVLRKSHLDEQYTARLKKKQLPDTIERLTRRAEGLTIDQATMKAHANDPWIIGGRAVSEKDAVGVLGGKLDMLPRHVMQEQRVELGQYQGLKFGVILHTHFSPEVYLEGAVIRQDRLSREHQGPRAVMNAIERLALGYGFECERTQQDLAVAEGQFRDYEARLGQPFKHEPYLKEMTDLRDQLRIALSGTQAEGLPNAAELADKIKDLKAANTIEAAPERSAKRTISAEEPVTSRIKRRAEASGPELEPGADGSGHELLPPESDAITLPVTLTPSLPTAGVDQLTIEPASQRDNVIQTGMRL